MALIQKQYVNGDCLLGMWRIEEDFDTLFNQLNLTPEETKKVMGFHNNHRKLEWLSVRTLINEVLGYENRIVYNEHRKPFLSDNQYQISISHSRALTSVMLSQSKRVGIDLEYMSHKITNVAHKFINEKEYITSVEEQQRLHMYIHWCAKEALYKICDKHDINFKDNLTIQPFELDEEGDIIGVVDNVRGNEQFDMHYSLFENYVVVWCTK